jgi:hypothetical protein
MEINQEVIMLNTYPPIPKYRRNSPTNKLRRVDGDRPDWHYDVGTIIRDRGIDIVQRHQELVDEIENLLEAAEQAGREYEQEQHDGKIEEQFGQLFTTACTIVETCATGITQTPNRHCELCDTDFGFHASWCPVEELSDALAKTDWG